MKLVSKKNFLLAMVIAVLLAIVLSLYMRSQIRQKEAATMEEKASMVEERLQEEDEESNLDETL